MNPTDIGAGDITMVAPKLEQAHSSDLKAEDTEPQTESDSEDTRKTPSPPAKKIKSEENIEQPVTSFKLRLPKASESLTKEIENIVLVDETLETRTFGPPHGKFKTKMADMFQLEKEREMKVRESIANTMMKGMMPCHKKLSSEACWKQSCEQNEEIKSLQRFQRETA